jgi:hypothetical protein
LRPSYATALFKVVTTALDAVVHAELPHASAGGKHRASRLACDERTERTKEKNQKQNADRRNGIFAGTIGPGRACKRQAHIYRRSTAVLSPKESFIARDAASGHASWDAADSGLSFKRTLPTPACPSPANAPRTPTAGRLMPKAARERVASPRAGTALAPQSGNACQPASD